MNYQLYCPRCLSPLVYGEGTRIYQTLVEHVSDPNGTIYPKSYLICSSSKCPTRINDDIWEEYGDFHHSSSYPECFFFLSCNRALNSGSRKFTLQQRKKRYTILNLIWFKVYIESSPIPDEMGLKIIGYKLKLRACTRTNFRGGWVEYIPGIYMLFFCFKSFKQDMNKFLEDPSNKYSLNELLEDMEYPSWDSRWWKHLSVWVANMLYPGLKKTLLEIKIKNRCCTNSI
jgi:hypothetical protein